VIELDLVHRSDEECRAGRDRLELLAALLNAPGVEPLYRDEIIRIPPDHPAYGLRCLVKSCGYAGLRHGLCTGHHQQWREQSKTGLSREAFHRSAPAPEVVRNGDHGTCRICPERPAVAPHRLCARHQIRWSHHYAATDRQADLQQWMTTQQPYAGFGECLASVCSWLACSPLGLCLTHRMRYRVKGQ
jgi:hypothetical protein